MSGGAAATRLVASVHRTAKEAPMELIVTILVAFPLGFLIRNRMAAFVAYIAVHAFVFTFQAVNLMVEWVGGRESAFGPYPKGSDSDVLAYGLVNLVIYAAGFGLVYAGSRVAARRRARSGGVNLEPANAH
jgi:hypothetical protein